jgi:hypothetical protein
MQKCLFMIAWIALGLSGCASTPEASRERDADAKQFRSSPAAATVYIYRPDDANDDPVLWIDGRLIGATLPRTFYRVHLDPGKHVFTGLAADNGGLALETRPGEVYFVAQIVSAGQSYFRLINKDLGRKAVTNCCTLLENWAPGQRPLLR